MSDRYDEHLRERESQRYGSTRLWHPTPNLVGMVGEKVNAEYWSADQDLRNRPEGDRGVDLEIELDTDDGPRWFRTNARATTSWELRDKVFVNCEKTVAATIYVRVFVTSVERREGHPTGWVWGRDLARVPPELVRGEQAYVAERLRPMIELDARYTGRWRHG